MSRACYQGWIMTVGGGTYYVAIVVLDLMLSAYLIKTDSFSLSNRFDLNLFLSLVIAFGSTAVILYLGVKRESQRVHRIMPGLDAEKSAPGRGLRRLLLDVLYPPLGLFFVTSVVWFAGKEGVLIPSGKMLVMLTTMSFITVLYPLFHRIFR